MSESMSFDKSDYDFGQIKRTPFYFGPDNKRLIGWLHTPVDKSIIKNTGVVVCPPIGVEYMSTYRSLRYVADYFALSGIPAFRFDYHGTGDSSGLIEEPERVNDWLWSIEEAGKQLLKATGCNSFGLFGLRIGATLASVVAEHISLSFLVLWAAPESGRKYIREVKMAQMAGVSETENLVDERFIEVGGAIYYPETVEAISDIDLYKVKPNAERILIIPRDDLSVKHKLLNAWTDVGLNVEQRELPGSADMLLSGYFAVVPHETIASIVEWVNKTDPVQSLDQYNEVASQTSLTSMFLEYSASCREGAEKGKTPIKETLVRYGEAEASFGILSEPVNKPAVELPIVIISNSGITHRVGPNRLYVLLARQLSSLGFRCFRIDMAGIGDSIVTDESKENIEYIKNSSEYIYAAISGLNSNYKDYKYILMGICSGAYFSFHAAIELEEINVVECVLINPLTFYWDHENNQVPFSGNNFTLWSWYCKAITRPISWIRLVKGRIDVLAFFLALFARLKILLKLKAKHMYQRAMGLKKDRPAKDLDWDLVHLAHNNTPILFVLARSDPGYDILMTTAGKTVKKLMKEKSIQVEFIENADHTFSRYQPRSDVIETVVEDLSSRYIKSSDVL